MFTATLDYVIFMLLHSVLLVAIMNVTGQGLDPFMGPWILVVNVVYCLKPCFMYQLRTEKNSGKISLNFNLSASVLNMFPFIKL